MKVLSKIKAAWLRALQDYRRWHVPARCRPSGCDCPCGYCHHDRRHIAGED